MNPDDSKLLSASEDGTFEDIIIQSESSTQLDHSKEVTVPHYYRPNVDFESNIFDYPGSFPVPSYGWQDRSQWNIPDPNIIAPINNSFPQMFAGLVESPIMFTESIPVKNKLVKRKTIRVPKHKCSVCGKTFLAKRQYQDHMNTHSGIRAHPCDICEQSFYSLPNLIAHKAIHSTVRPYTCTSCGAGFNQKNDLFVHLVTLVCT